jgi:superfamily II DNA or RNA helicase
MQYSIFDKPNHFSEWFNGLPTEGDEDGLRYYQREAFKAFYAGVQRVRSQLIVMATGLGKTKLAAVAIQHWDKGDILFLAHRDELIRQTERELLATTGSQIAIEKANEVSSPRSHIVVGSVQSMNKKRLERLGRNRFGLVIVDECHHAVAKSYQMVFDWFHEAKLMGLTATPDRGDEKALGAVFDEVAYVMDISDGVDAGFLVPVHGKEVILKNIHLDNIKKTAGDLNIGELDEEMLKSAEGVVNKTIELEPNRQAICFFPGVRSAEFAAAKFNAVRPDSARFISGTTDPDVRAGIVADFKRHRFQYLCNCQVATEGFDAPSASLIVLARPTLSRSLYAQMIGRGTRVLPGTVDHLHGKALSTERRAAIATSRKPDMVILDFVGASTKHALMTAVDVLGGNYSEAEVKLAKKKAKSGGDARAALEQARKELLQLASATKAKVTATVRPFDPFRVLGLSIVDEDRYATRFGGKPASSVQVAKLAAWGVPQQELNGLSTKAASRLIDRCQDRTKQGLATYKMMRQLQRFGITDLDISFDRAKAGLTYIESKGWGDRGTVDPTVLRDIINHKRDAGED